MAEPAILGYPVTLLLLYFIFYGCAGWAVETTYCSVLEKRFVVRGFLYGPICPIYGAGVLLMILFFTPLKGNPVVFYFTAMFIMSAWEYFVGWFLEITTHIKYWDYSNMKFNIKGRICLPISLCWGVLSYVAIFVIHPPVERLITGIPFWLRYLLAGICLALLAVDAVTTIRKLALITKAMNRLQTANDELRLQLALARADLGDNLEEAGEVLREKLDSIHDRLPETMSSRLDALMEYYDELLSKVEKLSRRFRNRYRSMSSRRYTLDDVRTAGLELKRKLRAAKKARKVEKELAKAGK